MDGYGQNGETAAAEQPMEQQYEQQDFSTDVGVAGGDANGGEQQQQLQENPGDRINASKNDDDDK